MRFRYPPPGGVMRRARNDRRMLRFHQVLCRNGADYNATGTRNGPGAKVVVDDTENMTEVSVKRHVGSDKKLRVKGYKRSRSE